MPDAMPDAAPPPTAAEPAARGALEINDVGQVFGKTVALREIDLEISAGEFVGLLGPSGCGKSTLLRILAGFIRPTRGTVRLDGRDITGVPAEKRPMNMVFQQPTLFPHLDVFENVAFGLRVAHARREEVETRVTEALEMVRLGHLARRRAYELSGGQMQRVALARAIVNRPEVVLLDEPLSALDLKIRLEMEVELRRLHAETGATFIYVTHDQSEAMSMSDRVAVFSEGWIEQLGTPHEIYTAPQSSYVARFVGDANVIPVEVAAVDSDRASVQLTTTRVEAIAGEKIQPGPAQLVVRAENITFAETGPLEGEVIDRAFRGKRTSYLIEVDGLPKPLRAEFASSRTGNEPDVGATVKLGWEPSAGRLIPAERQSSEEAAATAVAPEVAKAVGG